MNFIFMEGVRMSGHSGVRVQLAERRQIQWQAFALDQLLPEEHTARLVWAYVESLDVSRLYETNKNS